ncbi:MAG: hypothetical protein A3D28_02390 [Omnitrophica bacterium RIFCSPHIGHO2_02_FULL_63_14]|nr:MAG: hypothetical protein A3D28_02390 [Omnitrophica bacterium RIFCSPHIGHO2_02_FULL_63_14]
MKELFLTALFAAFFSTVAFAAQRVETADLNTDGRPDKWTTFDGERRVKAEQDSDFDGRVDRWFIYDQKGSLRKSAQDKNKDGKPDSFRELVKGRSLVLQEQDRNFDGRIDRRSLLEWKPDRKMPLYTNRLEYLIVPGYVSLWTEEDKDFDGKIDVYTNKAKKGSPSRVGQPIDKPPQEPGALTTP